MEHKFATTWLNPKDKQGWGTQQWKEMLLDIKEGRITTLKQVTDVYKLSRETESIILKELKK